MAEPATHALTARAAGTPAASLGLASVRAAEQVHGAGLHARSHDARV